MIKHFFCFVLISNEKGLREDWSLGFHWVSRRLGSFHFLFVIFRVSVGPQASSSHGRFHSGVTLQRDQLPPRQCPREEEDMFFHVSHFRSKEITIKCPSADSPSPFISWDDVTRLASEQKPVTVWLLLGLAPGPFPLKRVITREGAET